MSAPGQIGTNNLKTKSDGEGPAERQAYDATSPWWGEHASRYEWVGRHVKGKYVLDAACGAGFGGDILIKSGAGYVAGLDQAVSAVVAAKEEFSAEKNAYLTGDATNLPFAADTFDVITSFETIEHVPNCRALLREFRRILKRDGVLYCSTPNKAVTSPDGDPTNPYHFQEFTESELDRVLSEVFVDVRIFGQRCRRETTNSTLRSLVWSSLAARGIRKLPWKLRDGLSKRLTGFPIFPKSDEFTVTPKAKDATTLMAICGEDINRSEFDPSSGPGVKTEPRA